MADTKLSALGSATLSESDELYINDGGTSTKCTIAELRTILCGKGTIELNLLTAREIGNDLANEFNDAATAANQGSGGILANDTSPQLERENLATDQAIRIRWASSNVDEIQFAPVPLPPDLDETSDVTVHIMGLMSGATDTPTIDVQVFEGIGDTEMGGASTAFGSALAEETLTIANANITGHPGFFNISFTPGAHTTDILTIYAAWLEYTRKAPV